MDAPSWDLAVSLSDLLTPRQLEIARCISRGMLGKEIAAELGVSYTTVRAHIYNPSGIFERLGVGNNVGVAWAVWSDEAEGAIVSEPIENKPTARGWQVREGAVHWVPETLPAGEQAWTDYREDDCMLRRQKPCDGSQPVRVTSPLFPGARVRVKACEGGWEAVKDG
jgi:DNA-binding CsgD family transcriptional regulator